MPQNDQHFRSAWDCANYALLETIFNNDVVAQNTSAKKFPDYICHYTSFAGLKGIIESNSIWLTPLSFMNDYSEFMKGHHSIHSQIIPKYIGAIDPSENKDFVTALRRAADDFASQAFNEYFNTYISCWSQCEILGDSNSVDALAMWRGYAADGNGVAIVIDVDATGISPKDESDIRLLKVQYEGDEALEKRTFRCLNIFFQLIKSEIILSKTSISELFDCIKSIYQTIALTHKVVEFQEEREWRLIMTSDTANILSGAEKVFKGLLQDRDARPIVKLNLDGQKSIIPKPVFLKDIVSHIMIGPCSWEIMHSRKLAIEHFLRENGFLKTKVLTSKIPYRGRR